MTREQFRGVGVRVFVFCVLLLLSNASADSGNGSLASPPTRQSEVSGFDPTFQPSMAVIVIVLISAFFFIAFFSIYIRQCANDPQSVRRPSIVRLGFSWRTPRGLETAVIKSFPTFVYSTVKALKIGKGSLECAVCLSEFEDDETLRLLPPCSHAFHPECIDAWLASHVTCPVCRADLREDPGEFVAENVAIDVPPDEADRPGNEEHQGDSEVATPRNDLSIPVTDDLSTPIPNVTANYPPTKTLRFMAAEIRPTKRPLKSIRKFSRSHSTGHSLMPPETHERFTLRLPENVRRQLIASGRMNRVASCSVFPVDAEGSSRGGHRVGEGSSRGGRSLRRARDDSTRSDGWTFSIAPPFIYRSFSSSTHGRDNSEPTEPEPLSPKSSTSTSQPTPILRTPLDCLVSRPDPADRSPTSMPAKIQA